MKNTIKFALVGALLAVAAPVASAADCYKVSKQAAKEISAKPENVLAIVSKQIAANKGCACEIVKAAIVATEANKKQVAQIVEQAIILVPNKVSLVTTCALAVAPDAHKEIMAVSAKFVKNTGSGQAGAKSGAKGAVESAAGQDNKDLNIIDPLNLVGNDPNGNFGSVQTDLPPSAGGGGGQVNPGNTYSQP